ncbi:hypothetical protein BH11BAC3_BH11BAC3_41810 [soil metagenome]
MPQSKNILIMKRTLIAIACISCITFIEGCKTGGGDPKAALISFMEALNKHDIEGAKKYATAESSFVLDMANKAGDQKKTNTGEYDISKLEIGDPKIEGDMATVPVKVKQEDIVINYKMKKESGSWKVAFDKASIMSMGMDAMKDNSDKLFGNDSLKSAMDQLKNLPMDSIKNAINQLKGMPMDSLKSAMDQLKKMNMDSLRDAMKGSIKMLDSLQKH